ncbi:MAG TPA: hypothetical protein VGQ06_08355 [Gemmatimonadales bacterium]|jgi:hypothetical protein|nr:hypothetical protein [Gemmatimonadales bacterium]
MHAVIRRYRVRLGTVASAAQHAETSLLPQMNQLPGFVAYYLLDAGDGVLASISVCETSEGADASAALAADWFRSDWPAFQVIPPEITDGEVLVHAEVGRATGRRRVERRAATDRRAANDRRVDDERRRATLPCKVEQRSGFERRIIDERRSGVERRDGWRVTQTSRSSRRLGIAPSRRTPSPIA